MNIYLIGLLAYSALLMTVGIVISRRIKTASDFLVAGRRLGPGLIFTTFLAANLGAGSTVGATGLGYRLGLSAWWWVGSASIGTFVLATMLGPRLWEIAQRYSLHTILNVVIGLPKWAGCAIGGAVAIVYCSAGGLVAAAFVNIVELTVTMSGLLLAVPFALSGVGGWGHLTQTISASATSSAPLLSLTGIGLKPILAYVAILVPSFIVSPGLVQKLYGARDQKTVRLGVGLNSLAQAGFAIVPALLGLCALAAFPHLNNPELALPTVMMKLLPKWLGIWGLVSIFSAELSATDAILFMLSTSLTGEPHGGGDVRRDGSDTGHPAAFGDRGRQNLLRIAGRLPVRACSAGSVLEGRNLESGTGEYRRSRRCYSDGVAFHPGRRTVASVAAGHRNRYGLRDSGRDEQNLFSRE